MRFHQADYPEHGKGKELTDAIAEEHPKRLIAFAEDEIARMHHHDDGSPVELHEVGGKEFLTHSMSGSLEGRLSGVDINGWQQQPQQDKRDNAAAAKIEYERKSPQNNPMQKSGGHDAVMMGCNCGASWTVTGDSAKADSSTVGGLKIEQYSHAGGQAAGYNASGGSGSGPGEYRTGGGARQDYKG